MSAAKKIKLAAPDGGEPVGGTGGLLAVAPRSGSASSPTADITTIESLSVETIATVLGYLSWDEILLARVSRTFREAATRTLVPFEEEDEPGKFVPEFCADSLRNYDALMWMSQALPNLQQIYFYHPLRRYELVIEDGEDADPDLANRERLRRRMQLPTREMDVVANFRNLRRLSLNGVHLNGKYPCLLGFPHLQRFELIGVGGLKLDLEMIGSSFRALEELICGGVPLLQGSMKSLSALRKTLRMIKIGSCPAVNGDLMDLADLPLLETLWVHGSSVSGDVRHIGEKDFPVLYELYLPDSVCGSTGRPFGRVADAPEVMNALCRLKKRNGWVRVQKKYTFMDVDANVIGPRARWSLAEDSPDRYPADELLVQGYPLRESGKPPFLVEIVEVGACIGWRWTNSNGGVCKNELARS